jgi:hypothetical protein
MKDNLIPQKVKEISLCTSDFLTNARHESTNMTNAAELSQPKARARRVTLLIDAINCVTLSTTGTALVREGGGRFV